MESLMKQCLRLAARGRDTVPPNPMVGCLIVRDGQIIARGYHRRYGGEHAELEALRRAGKKARGADLYVNLEPCNHQGKTPPCAPAIAAAGIRRVVFGMHDPNPRVPGMGAAWLASQGIETIGPVMEADCARLNEVFLVNVRHARPFITIKLAQTLDGFIAPLRGSSRWITGETARARVREMRCHVDAVLVGAETVRKDDPTLLQIPEKGRMNRRRIVLSSSLDLPMDRKIFIDPFAAFTIVMTSTASADMHPRRVSALLRRGIRVLAFRTGQNGLLPLRHIMKELYRMEIFHLLVEGGGRTAAGLLEAGLADKLELFIATKILGNGKASFPMKKNGSLPGAWHLRTDQIRTFDEDLLLTCYPMVKR